MPKGDKYQDLTRYLEESKKTQLSLTFDEIARIVGGLPQSAYDHPNALWHDSSRGSLSYGWLNANYSARVFPREKSVTFTLKDSNSNELPLIRIDKKIRQNDCTLKRPYQDVIGVDNILNAAQRYYSSIVDSKYTRLRSWEHCRCAFISYYGNKVLSDFEVEHLSLHLAWYLASWGMLRNSALINFDYSIHKSLIIELSDLKYRALFIADGSSESITLTMETATIIRNYYQAYWDQTAQKSYVSDTLVSKVMLGIFGCTPAYDNYFRNSVKTYQICNGNFDRQSITMLWNYYRKNEVAFDDFKNNLPKDVGSLYTPMKILDMGMWQLGAEGSKRSKS